jgi:hypothetical protein
VHRNRKEGNMKTALILVFFIMLTMPTAAALAGGNSIDFNGIDIVLGMTQDVAISKLTSTYDVTKMYGDENNSHWRVATKGQDSTAYGGISFKSKKVSYAVKNWKTDDQERNYEFAKALYGLITQLVKERNTNCQLLSGEEIQPQISSKAALIVCGGKTIRVDVIEDKVSHSALLTEELNPK